MNERLAPGVAERLYAIPIPSAHVPTEAATERDLSPVKIATPSNRPDFDRAGGPQCDSAVAPHNPTFFEEQLSTGLKIEDRTQAARIALREALGPLGEGFSRTLKVLFVASAVETVLDGFNDLRGEVERQENAYSDILDDVADDWAAQGYEFRLAEVKDMAAVGRSFLEAVADATKEGAALHGWHLADSPVEIVFDLLNLIDEKDREADNREIAAMQTRDLLKDEIAELKASVEFLAADRMAIVVERNEMEERLQAALDPASPAHESLIAYRGWRDRAETAEKLIADSAPVVRFVNELASMTDMEAEFMGGDEIRQRARAADPSAMVVPRFYGEQDRNRARQVLYLRLHQPDLPDVQMVAATTGELVDLVAQALGMRKAGE